MFMDVSPFFGSSRGSARVLIIAFNYTNKLDALKEMAADEIKLIDIKHA